jgi:hypothetical protein
MSKLKLRIDALEVESFATGVDARLTGTVQGHAPPPTHKNEITCGATCDANPNCIITDDPTCIEPCGTTLCGPDTSVTCPVDTVDFC